MIFGMAIVLELCKRYNGNHLWCRNNFFRIKKICCTCLGSPRCLNVFGQSQYVDKRCAVQWNTTEHQRPYYSMADSMCTACRIDVVGGNLRKQEHRNGWGDRIQPFRIPKGFIQSIVNTTSFPPKFCKVYADPFDTFTSQKKAIHP